MFHPWHDIENPDAPEGLLKCIIEIPRGTKVKYELDKTTGLLRLDRVLYSAVYYPINYGFIPRTLDYDGDPLDILVLCSERIESLALCEVRVIGVMHMVDSGTNDDKIISVPIRDIAMEHILSMSDLPPHLTVELKDFFENYKVLENKEVTIERFEDASRAIEVILHCQQRYIEYYGGKVK